MIVFRLSRCFGDRLPLEVWSSLLFGKLFLSVAGVVLFGFYFPKKWDKGDIGVDLSPLWSHPHSQRLVPGIRGIFNFAQRLVAGDCRAGCTGGLFGVGTTFWIMALEWAIEGGMVYNSNVYDLLFDFVENVVRTYDSQARRSHPITSLFETLTSKG